MSEMIPERLSDNLHAYTKSLVDKAKWVGIKDPKVLERLTRHAIPDSLKDSGVLPHLINLIRESISPQNEAKKLSPEQVSKLVPDRAALKRIDDAIQTILPNIDKLSPSVIKKITQG